MMSLCLRGKASVKKRRSFHDRSVDALVIFVEISDLNAAPDPSEREKSPIREWMGLVKRNIGYGRPKKRLPRAEPFGTPSPVNRPKPGPA